jgi:hypothetical protein
MEARQRADAHCQVGHGGLDSDPDHVAATAGTASTNLGLDLHDDLLVNFAGYRAVASNPDVAAAEPASTNLGPDLHIELLCVGDAKRRAEIPAAVLPVP